MIKVIDNFFDKCDDIEKLFRSGEFSWYYTDFTSNYTIEPESHPEDLPVLKKIQDKNKDLLITDYLQFSHSFYKFIEGESRSIINTKEKYLDITKDIVKAANKKLNENYKQKNIIRSKANLQTQNSINNTNKLNPPHKDMDFPHYVMLYYVNDSDGDTFFFDTGGNLLKRVSPKKGRLVYFNGELYHSGSNPVKSGDRMVVNINLDYDYEQDYSR